MLVEVRNVKEAKFASEETRCFQATVVLDGQVAGKVRNDGHGGANRYEPRGLYDRLETYAKTLPDITKYNPPLKMTADLVIDQLVDDFQVSSDFKKAVTTRVVLVNDEGQVLQTKKLPKGTNVLTVARTFVEKPGIVHVLNLLPETEALNLFRGKTASEGSAGEGGLKGVQT